MAELGVIKVGEKKGRVAIVRRVVPGKLVYVEVKPEEVYAMKLDRIVIRNTDGSFSTYRGEKLSDLGLDSGKQVTVWTNAVNTVPENLVVDMSTGPSATIGSTISTAVADYFRR